MANDANRVAAAAAFDKALAAKPEQDHAALSAAAHHLSALRDQLAKQQRERGPDPDSRRNLEHVNAAISAVLAVHFPLGGVPWPELEKARGWLDGVTDPL